MRKRGVPRVNEIVICRVKNINPHSATCELVEYPGKQGLIFAGEVAGRWVKNISDFLKVNQYIVCRVLKVDKELLTLSKKRVSKDLEKKFMNFFKRELKAEKMLEMAASKLGKNLDEAYEEVGYMLQDEFGSLFKAFEHAVKRKELLRRRLSKEWFEVIEDIASSKFSEKEYKVKAELKMFFYENGIEKIREIVSSIKSKGYEVSYISAPRYSVSKVGKNYKKLRSELENVLEGAVREIKRLGGTGGFEIIKR